MIRAASLRAELSKEIRALLPLWTACLVAVAGAFVRRDGVLLEAAIVAYIAGPLAIGAHSIGHEYTYRTLPMLLSQPAGRRRVYLMKCGVMASMVLTLAAFAGIVLMHDDAMPRGMWRHATVQILPVLGGLGVAPWLTMICRSSLAGMLLAGSIASVTLLASMAVAALWFGIGAGAAQAMITEPWAIGMIAFCALAGVLAVRRFSDLEAIESAPPSLHLPRWVKRAEPMRIHQPLRALAEKELHLQQLTLAVAGLFMIQSVVVSLLQRAIPLWSTFPNGAVTLLYCMCLSILIGALASAEERQQGTLEWQLLQPTAAWQQWMVKVGVAFGLALLLGAGLPMVLIQITPLPDARLIHMWTDLAVVSVLMAAGSLYLSSLSSSGVRAMVLSLPVGIGVVLFIQTVGGMWSVSRSTDPTLTAIFLGRVLAVGLIPLLLWFAFVNHTSSERQPRRIVRQGVSIALVMVMGIAFVVSLAAVP